MRQFITEQTLANQVSMLRSQLSGCILIVEGGTDSRLYRKFVDERLCTIIPGKGKDNAVETLEVLEEREVKGVLCVVDADFWNVDGYVHPSENLLLTDSHDLETMMLQTSALETLLIELGSREKILALKKDVRSILLGAGVTIGFLRYISIKQLLNLKFDDLAYEKFLDKTTLEINLGNMIATVLNISCRHDLQPKDLANKIISHLHQEHDEWQVSCGHDLIQVLSFGLRRTLGTNQAHEVKSDALEMNLRLAYERIHFTSTKLHKKMQNWEEKNPPYSIFAE